MSTPMNAKTPGGTNPGNPFLQRASIPGIKHIILVGSGKGGVGKSTVSLNLASGLKHLGLKVGVLDADIYGPSLPRLIGCVDLRPDVSPENKIIPIQRFGLKVMGMGFLVDEDSGIVWRGPMLFKALDQMLREVIWGELDFLIVDLPPGTGDVALTLAQKVPISGAVLVCTPQNIALADAKKAVDMFERVQIPILGVIENMSYLIESNGSRRDLFPPGDLNGFLDQKGIEKLATLPFSPNIGLVSEAGVPIIDSDSSGADAISFKTLARRIAGFLGAEPVDAAT